MALACDAPDAEWWCARYKNCGRIEEFLGDTQPYWVEVVAVRVAQWLNGCVTLDWGYENWITTLVRETGPGFRVGYFLTAVYVVFVSSAYLERPLLFQYDIHHPSDDMASGNVTLLIAFYLWAFDFALLTVSYYLIRHHGTPSVPGENGEFTPFYRISTRRLREEREKEPNTAYKATVRGFFALVFTLHFFVGVFAMHTILSHMFIRRNVWFAVLLGVKAAMALVSSVDDLTNIGSPWGIQEASKEASVMLSFRALFLIPLTLIWSAAAVAASFPPSYCEEC